MVASFALGRRALPLPIPAGDIARAGAASLAMAMAVMSLPSQGGALELMEKASVGAMAYGLAALSLDLCGLRARLGAMLARRRESLAA